jgi:hypothetical protein
LADEHYFAEDRAAGNDWLLHARTSPTSPETLDVIGEKTETLLANAPHFTTYLAI